MSDTRLLTGVGVLAAVTEAGNFARAAEMLGLTPSAVSRAVARLEARVGVRLFDRNPREVSLTEEGRRFHTQVMPLLAGLDEEERPILELSLQGYTTREISERLGRAERTVRLLREGVRHRLERMQRENS